jgi:peptidoglycan/LPS O-acetylase OafA/YrhL
VLCCTAVVFCHSFEESTILADRDHRFHTLILNLGGTGVFIFFSLSGFLITKLLLDEIYSNGRINLRYFYIRRALRIWPVYYAAVAVGFSIIAVASTRVLTAIAYVPDGHFRRMLAAFVFFVANWYHDSIPTVLKVLWSVSVEEQFYILFPLALSLSKGRYPVLKPAFGALLIAWTTRAYLAYSGQPAIRIYVNTFAISDHLILGALLAQLLHSRPQWLVSVIRRLRGIPQYLALAGGFYLASLDWTWITGWSGFLFFGVSAILATATVGTIGLGTGSLSYLFSRRISRFLGGLTYSGYVFHMYGVAIAWVACKRWLPSLSAWDRAFVRACVATLLTFLIAYFSKVSIEDRFLRMKSRFAPRSNDEDRATFGAQRAVARLWGD